MRVLFTTNLPSPYRVKFFSELGKHCDLTVLYERHSAADRDSRWKTEKDDTYKEIYLRGLEIGNENSLCFDVIKYLKMDYDIIVIGVYSSLTALLAINYLKLKDRKFIISTDGGFIKNDNKIKKALKSYLISSASYWLATGENASKYLQYYGAKKEKIQIYPFTSLDEKDILGEAVSVGEMLEKRRELGIDGKKVVISVGRFIECKGFELLIGAIEKIGFDGEVYFVGGERERLEQLYGNVLPRNVHTVNFIDKETLKKYYMASDLFVLPTRGDTWGLVINEAMACSLPVIVTNRCIAGLELVEDGVNGSIVDVSVESLATAIQNFFDNSEAVETMREKSLKIIKNYTFQNMAASHMELFNRMKEDL